MFKEYLRGKPYTIGAYTLRAQMVDALLDYVDRRVEPGGFLSAALSNDFVGAVGRADNDNVYSLPALACFLYNELPANCWGSVDKVRTYLARPTP